MQSHLQELITSGERSNGVMDPHVNIMKMKAVPHTISAFQHCLSGSSPVLMSDNLMRVVNLNIQGRKCYCDSA